MVPRAVMAHPTIDAVTKFWRGASYLRDGSQNLPQPRGPEAAGTRAARLPSLDSTDMASGHLYCLKAKFPVKFPAVESGRNRSFVKTKST